MARGTKPLVSDDGRLKAKALDPNLEPEDLEGLSDEHRQRVLQLNTTLAEKVRQRDEAAKTSEPETTGGGKAAGGATKERRAPRRPASSSRRPPASGGRRLARRIVRETPGAPGPSATGLLLSFIGTTVLVIGLVVVVSNGDRLGFIPGWLATATSRLTDPTDPLF